ncbi:MAG: tetratricopeptide repeat protein [Calditrichaeota bacterium]|nr:MAG: tetratricopeptide repeat protein [Calditrichota bacterium]
MFIFKSPQYIFILFVFIASCKTSTKQNPHLAEEYYGKALVAKSELDYQTALAYLDSALANNPKHFMAWLHKGLIYAQLQDFNRSDECYREALKIEPEFLDAMYNLGNNALRRQKYKDAIEIYRKLLKLKEAPEFWHNMGRAYLELGDQVQAQTCFQRAIELDSTYAYGYHSLGTLAERQGNYQQAVIYYEKATHFAPQSDEYWFKFGLVLLRTGDQIRAEEAFRKAIALNPNHTGAVFNLAKILNKKKSADAQQWLKRAEELRKQDTRISRLRRGIIQHPDDPDLHYRLAMEYVPRKEWKKAVQQFKQALLLDPGDHRSRINLANVYLIQGKMVKAIQEYLRVLEDNPQSREALANLGTAYARLGKTELARKYWQRLLRVDPNNRVARQGLQKLTRIISK